MRAMGLEAHAAEEVHRQHAPFAGAVAQQVTPQQGTGTAPAATTGVTEGFDGADATPLDQVARHALHQHPAEAAAASVRRDVHGGEQHRVR